jgi:hypothetical protein
LQWHTEPRGRDPIVLFEKVTNFLLDLLLALIYSRYPFRDVGFMQYCFPFRKSICKEGRGWVKVGFQRRVCPLFESLS